MIVPIRTYEASHPWINFALNMQAFPFSLSTALGEASSKCEHLAGTPLAPEVANRLHKLYLAKGVLATTAIEGNTLSEEEVQEHLEGKLELPSSRAYLGHEIDNIITACNVLTKDMGETGEIPINPELLDWMNGRVLKDLEVDDFVVPGEIRKTPVYVGRYQCAPAEDCRYLIERYCEALNEFPAPTENKNIYAIIKAVFAHLYFVWIHPYGDGNGRTARLIELYILLSAGIPQPACHLLSNHYNRTRTDYYRMLDRAVRSESDMVGFFHYAVQGMVDGLREQITVVRQLQFDVVWKNFVHERFHDKNSPSDVRQRHLVLSLKEDNEPVSRNGIRTLTAELALEYAGKSSRTISRDLNMLEEMGLIIRTGKSIQANRKQILAFLPWRNTNNEERDAVNE